MNGRESLRVAWRAIAGHKLRSSLTTLGVIIGVGTVIVFVVLGGAFEANIVADIEDDSDGTGMLVNTQQVGNGGFQFIEAPVYTEHDIEQLRGIDGVDYVAPTATLPAAQLQAGDQRRSGGFAVQASSSAPFETDEFVAGGVFEGPNEAILTETLADSLEWGLEVGDTLTIRYDDGTTQTVEIVGLIEDGLGAGTGASVILPVEGNYETTVETPRETEELAFSSLLLVAEDVDSVERVQTAATEYFETDADATQLKDDAFNIEVQTVEDAIDQFTDFIDQLTIFVAGIAGISLVVGSIGIANIMIVSVTERTREIGIMKAVGATNRDVMQLFLVEALVLGVIGSLVGIAGGLGVGYAGASIAGWPMAYPLDWIVIAMGVGITVGIVAGLYPAWRAARTDPIEALRQE